MKRNALAIALAMFAAAAQGVLVVNYNYDFLNASASTLSGRTLDLGDGTTGTKGMSFNAATAMIDGTSSAGPGSSSVVVYGGWKAVISNGANISTSADTPSMSSSNGRLVSQAPNVSAAGVTCSAQAVVLWDSANFLGGSLGAGQTYGFDGSADSSFAINLFRLDGTARMVVREGSDYFISQAFATALGSYTLKATDVQWAAYDPVSDFTVVPGSGFAAKTFSNVTAIGYYGNVARTGNQGRLILADQGLDVNLSVIPEPATLSLVLAMGGGLVWIRRRFFMG